MRTLTFILRKRKQNIGWNLNDWFIGMILSTLRQELNQEKNKVKVSENIK